MGSRMKKFAWCALFVFFSCAFVFAVDNNIPVWVRNHHTVYPNEKYIAFRASADTSENAKNKAVSEMAFYFQTQVNNRRQVNYESTQITEKGSVSIKEQQDVSNVTDVSTNINLVAVETTEPYYEKQSETYYCVAYMERETAWLQYKPTLDDARGNFYGYYKRGLEDADAFSRIRYLGYAYTAAQEFLDKLSFAQIISESRTSLEYGADMQTMASVNSKQQSEKIRTKLYLAINSDVGDEVFSAVSKVFAGEGFSITQKKSEATYDVSVDINYNQAKDGDVIVMRPSVKVSVNGKSGTAYSFVATASKVAQYTENRARTKAAANIASAVIEKMPDDLVAAMSGGSHQ